MVIKRSGIMVKEGDVADENRKRKWESGEDSPRWAFESERRKSRNKLPGNELFYQWSLLHS